jgi:hypothetical protein
MQLLNYKNVYLASIMYIEFIDGQKRSELLVDDGPISTINICLGE